MRGVRLMLICLLVAILVLALIGGAIVVLAARATDGRGLRSINWREAGRR